MSHGAISRADGVRARPGPAGPAGPLLTVHGLRKYFPVLRGWLRRQIGTVKAVDGVSFELRAGETLALVGESGCGKTTTGRAVLRLLEPDAGSVVFRGRDLRSLDREGLRRERRHMQLVFQDPFSSLNPRRTVGEIIGGPLLLHGLANRGNVEARTKEALGLVGLSATYAGRYPHEFSGGQRQRIGIARAVALRPELIVCDEPVSALDVSVQAQIINLLLALRDEFGVSYLFVAHDLSVVRHIAHHVAVMYLGKVVEAASRERLFGAPMHPYTQALLSAVPQPHPHPGRVGERIVLGGEVPSPIDPPAGCAFHTRCPYANERCRAQSPASHLVREDHAVACHLVEATVRETLR